MKKGTIIPLIVVIIVALVSTIFFVVNKDEKFDLKNISWTLTMDELEKEIGDEFTPISNSYIHTYKGIKKVTDLEAAVRYVFDSSSNLESIDVVIKTYEESAVDKILAMSEVIKSKESDVYKKYTLKIGDSLVELVGNVSENAIVLSIVKYTGQIENNSFVLNEIDWTATRDEVKEKTEIEVSATEETTLSDEGFDWMGDYDITVDEVLGGIAPKANKLEQAKRLLAELAETNNMMLSSEILELATEEDISKRTMETAKKELGIKAKKINNAWYWLLDDLK